MDPLIAFYLGSHPDSRGRFLADILEQDDLWLEQCHDYIQWLFPTREFSRVTPDAPTLTPEVEKIFLCDSQLRHHLKASFLRMLTFYGLQVSGTTVGKAANWSLRKSNWFTCDTHNSMRITRIMKSLSALGLKTDAVMLFDGLACLRDAEPDCAIKPTTFSFWEAAASSEPTSRGRKR